MLLSKKPLGETVCDLQLGGDVGESDSTLSNVMTDEVIAHRNVFGELMMARVLCQLDGAFIVHS
jgi:hypothetical protein